MKMPLARKTSMPPTVPPKAKCKHQWETLYIVDPDLWGYGGKLIVCCTECGKIKKIKI